MAAKGLAAHVHVRLLVVAVVALCPQCGFAAIRDVGRNAVVIRSETTPDDDTRAIGVDGPGHMRWIPNWIPMYNSAESLAAVGEKVRSKAAHNATLPPVAAERQTTLPLKSSRRVKIPKWALPEPAYPHHYLRHPSILFQQEPATLTNPILEPTPYYHEWVAAFLISLVVVVAVVKILSDNLKVDIPPPRSPEDMSAEGVGQNGEAITLPPVPNTDIDIREKPCCSWCCFTLSGLLCLLTFFFVIRACAIVNFIIESDHAANKQHDSSIIPLDDEDSGHEVPHKIENAGERAFEAGQGVALSVAFGCLIICWWRCKGRVQISNGSLSLFAIRGATISLYIAAMLEGVGQWMLHKTAGEITGKRHMDEQKTDLGIIGLTLIAGVAEEFAKIVVVFWGSWLSLTAMNNAGPGFCGSMCRVLIESPQALMLAGMAVGVGFMTVENAGYLIAVSVTPPTTDDTEKVDADTKDFISLIGNFARLMVIFVRVGLNLHPWFTAITCARAARLMFESRQDCAGLTLKDLVWAMQVAALAHFAYDALVLVMPGIISIFVPPVFWFACRNVFAKEWNKFEEARNASIAAPPPDEPAMNEEPAETEPNGLPLRG